MENSEQPQNSNQTPDSKSENTPRLQVTEIHHHHYEERRRFNFGKLFLGLVVVFFGLVFLAQETGWLGINWQLDWSIIWPVLIIFLGLSMLSGRGWASAILGTIIIIVVLAVIALMVIGGTSRATSSSTERISVDKVAGVTLADVIIKTGAGTIRIEGGAAKLVEGTWESNFVVPKIFEATENNIQTVTLTGEGSLRGFGSHLNTLNLKLNSEVPVRLNLNTGASSSDLDFSGITLDKLILDAGASSIRLNFGDLAATSTVVLHAGVSSVNVTLPKTVGVSLQLSSGLTSKNFADFVQISEHEYRSSNYDSVQKKIQMEFDLGVSSLNIAWR